ncbi:VOC family protein [Streptomyces sp. NBC_01218]|uniref:VOC family protein n=1 Tax=unclassified Streptomyces TaxID=2593676 RepID=UPI0023B9A7EB|nr:MULTISPECIES: VOC family protein [unclassified Streptomyces]WEH39085.1 VOC family protein [Streptomyces sp. AM 2-1-1]WSQ50741.1 VOC family protein [Streptomyces sp. NBC_01218]
MAVHKSLVLVLDSAEPMELADFYAGLLGAEVRPGQGGDYVEVVGEAGVHLAIRRDHGYAPPSWPRPDDAQQAHVLVRVAREDMDEAEREAIGLGATPVEARDNGGRNDTRHYADPAGHGFAMTAV